MMKKIVKCFYPKKKNRKIYTKHCEEKGQNFEIKITIILG